MKNILFAFLLLSVNVLAFDVTALKQLTDTMTPGQWLEIPDSIAPLYTDAELEAIRIANGGASIRGSTGSKSVIYAWNSAAYDPSTGRMWLYGGGHANYGGNEVYQFSFETLTWEPLTAPSPLTYKATPDVTCPWPESGPSVAHTYDGFTWNPKTQSIWLFRHTGFCNYNGVHVTNPYESKLWEFDPEAKTWTAHTSPEISDLSFGYGSTVYNPATQCMVVVPKYYGSVSRGPLEVCTDINGSPYFTKRGPNALGVGSSNLIMGNNGNADYPYFINYTNTGFVNIYKDPLTYNNITVLPQDVIDANLPEAGTAHHTPSNKLVYWTGNRNIWVWNQVIDPVAGTGGEWIKLENLNSPTAPTSGSSNNSIFGKFIYIPELDVFAGISNHQEGVWLYKLGDVNNPITDIDRACIGTTCYTSFADMTLSLQDGDIVTIMPGQWGEGIIIDHNNVRVNADGAIFTQAIQGKAAIVWKGNNGVINGGECFSINVSDGNGSCIRGEGVNLTINDMYAHDNQQGFLLNADSGINTFNNLTCVNNGTSGGVTGNQHCIYDNGSDHLIVNNSSITGTLNQGHEVKSRAVKTTIKNSIIATDNGQDSRVIDIPNGGEALIDNVVIVTNANSVNNDVIGWAWNAPTLHPVNSLTIQNSLIVTDDTSGKDILVGKPTGVVDPILTMNTIVGLYADTIPAGNCYFSDRVSAKILPDPVIDLTIPACGCN